MPTPPLSAHFANKQPSAIRQAQIDFSKRTDQVKAINLAIGNVSLPMHPAMQERMFALNAPPSPFNEGVVQYSSTVGVEETRQAFLQVLKASGIDTSQLYCQITDGGSQAMELVILGVCGPAGTSLSPLMLIEAAYANYNAMAKRTGRSTVSLSRHLDTKGQFSMPSLNEIDQQIQNTKPSALLVIPYDNPTGHFYTHELMCQLAKLCVKHNLWFISDEAYRELHYTKHKSSSIWVISEQEVPGITGRRISIESASKVWNACGLRIGAIFTDNPEFHQQSVAENTANLCSSVIGQYIFGSLAHQPIDQLQKWFSSQRKYYLQLMQDFRDEISHLLPKLIISKPSAAIYSVIDVRNLVDAQFSAAEFVRYCAKYGSVTIDGESYTLLLSPMSGFYSPSASNPGRTQMRVAFVEPPQKLALAPRVFTTLLNSYLSS